MKQIIRRPALRYHGGKWILGKWIINHFPKHRIYTESFGGGASVLMQKKRSYAEVYNDLNKEVVCVFKALRDNPEELKRRVILTPFSRAEFEETNHECIEGIDDYLEVARRVILRSYAGFGSASTNTSYKTGFRANSNRSGSTPAHDWANYPSHIDSFAKRFKGVVIECKDAIDVMTDHDSFETLHYIDPPYVHSTRNIKGKSSLAYRFEMTDLDHENLLNSIKSLKGMCVISGYQNDIYTSMLKDWKLVTKNALADGASKRKECLWINSLAWQNISKQMSMF